ncbi:MAG: DNA starvation/stationary phase protection protein [Chitinophagaceae bacterium]|nr:DNA starvation/stationary phase protection protein [Rubrivivax sp.]
MRTHPTPPSANAKSAASGSGPSSLDGGSQSDVEPRLHQESPQTQQFGDIVKRPNGLSEAVCRKSVLALNQTLADTMTLRDMYKKHHWQVVGPTFNQLHLLFDTHFEAQAVLVDLLAERIQLLGGISVAMAHDVAELTGIERPPKGREPAAVQLSRLIEAHEIIIVQARQFAEQVDKDGDAGSNDVLVSNVLRTNELQVWFLSEHLVAASPV